MTRHLYGVVDALDRESCDLNASRYFRRITCVGHGLLLGVCWLWLVGCGLLVVETRLWPQLLFSFSVSLSFLLLLTLWDTLLLLVHVGDLGATMWAVGDLCGNLANLLLDETYLVCLLGLCKAGPMGGQIMPSPLLLFGSCLPGHVGYPARQPLRKFV